MKKLRNKSILGYYNSILTRLELEILLHKLFVKVGILEM